MHAIPTARHGDVLTVIDNERRLIWDRPDPVSWVPTGVWPNADDARAIRRHLEGSRSLLVVLDAPHTTIPLLADEFAAAAAAPAVAARMTWPGHEPALVHIPALDWLPNDLRRRGLAFLDASTERASQVPPALRAPLVLSVSDPAAPHVRFAHRLRSGFALDHNLPVIVEHAFGGTRGALGVR